jgi:hypothetical protein
VNLGVKAVIAGVAAATAQPGQLRNDAAALTDTADYDRIETGAMMTFHHCRHPAGRACGRERVGRETGLVTMIYPQGMDIFWPAAAQYVKR